MAWSVNSAGTVDQVFGRCVDQLGVEAARLSAASGPIAVDGIVETAVMAVDGVCQDGLMERLHLFRFSL